MKIFRVALFIAGIILMLFVIVDFIVIRLNFGILINFCLASALILYSILFKRLIKIKWLNGCFFGAAGIYFVMVMFLGIYGNIETVTFTEDALIVAGAGIRGEAVTRPLADRLDRAAEYAGQNPGAIIVVSGGQGRGEDITEALAMERYLLEKGIPAARIIREEESTSTAENIAFSKIILDEYFNGEYTVALVSNTFHIYRMAYLAEKAGMKASRYGVRIGWYDAPVNYARECAAVVKTWVIG